MPTIVRLKHSGAKATLIGVGYGQYSSESSSALLGNLATKVNSGTNAMAAIPSPDGSIHWHATNNSEITSVDDQSPSSLLSES